MSLISSFKKKSSLSLLVLLMCGTCLLPVKAQSQSETKSVAKQIVSAPKPPKLKAISDQELETLIDKANKGDETAQNEVAQRYHWDNFADSFLKKVNIASWHNIENKAKNDYQFTYLLIVRNKLKKFPDVFKTIQEKADAGDPAFENILGNLYSQSPFPDGKWIAFEFHRKSASHGFAPGQLNLGSHYEDGTGVAKNDKKAFDLYKKAAAQGYAVAQFRLGEMYFEGRGTEENLAKAVESMEKSATQGYPQAQEFMTFLKVGGWDTNHPAKSGIQFTIAAAEKGNIYAQRTLGQRYQKAIGVKRDDEKAVSWWQKSANQDDTQSLNALGTFYYYDGSDENEKKKALTYYEKSAKLGDDEAKALIGFLTVKGLGLTKDEKKGIEILQSEAENGSAIAEYFLEILAAQQLK